MRCFYVIQLLIALAYSQCPDYSQYSRQHHAPFSSGVYNLSSQRPDIPCRTYSIPEVEVVINATKTEIADPDLSRLFENAYPNTLDTTIRWKGQSATTGEELTFVITGDINAMWLRDSANQMQSYLPLLRPSSSLDSLASLFRGVINLQARYLLTSPYCQSFQPPVESNIPPDVNPAGSDDTVFPEYSNTSVFECKYELDSLAAFLQVSTDYYTATNDSDFFGRYSWVSAVEAVLRVADEMMTPTYATDGSVLASPYTFTRTTTRASETLSNDGLGNPVQNGTGLIRSAFRPSDDSTIYQLFIPANMQFSRFLGTASEIMATLHDSRAAELTKRMRDMAASIRQAIQDYGIVTVRDGTQVYAFEVDGYGGITVMDDANIPSLLSAPFFGFVDRDDPVYQSTRALILSSRNPYYSVGPVISAVGSPHNGPGRAWPMSSIVRILTSDDDDEIANELKMLVSSTDGLGLIHESISSRDAGNWSRQWFSWVNGLFGQMILDLRQRKPELLKRTYQSK
ncbi:Meiotically up-regulated protein 157 protein [Sphaceloma murrayae]|uniref:Meiotically up-regulated protein 157 protein n=1 Tax=Sphaceloma murrayae TaxID=2082308 RepID=A0A2K1QKI4_9PEZI|nr:Meiotically up-regulated protein 157 protein [Sphaceloma murrayae]